MKTRTDTQLVASAASKPLGQPQDYVVFHKERQCHFARGIAVVGGKEQPWAGLISTDPISPTYSTNEDPFIWTRRWLFSYCHTSQMRHLPQARSYVQAGSRLFFCVTSSARRGILEVDTVFQVGRCEKWLPRGTIPANLRRFGPTSHEWLPHLRHGEEPRVVPGTHTGVFTYIAQMGGASFLPLDALGRPVRVKASEIFQEADDVLEKAVPENRSTYPIELTPAQASKLLGQLLLAPERVIQITSRTPQGFAQPGRA